MAKEIYMEDRRSFEIAVTSFIEEKKKSELPDARLAVEAVPSVNDENEYLCRLYLGDALIHEESLDLMYEDYEDDYSIELISDNFIARALRTLQQERLGYTKMETREDVLDSVIFQVVDIKKNSKLLKFAASRPLFGDLVMIFRKRTDSGVLPIISKGELEAFGIDADDLYDAALENLRNPDSVCVQSIELNIMEFGKDREAKDIMIFDELSGIEFGADIIGFDDWLNNRAEERGGKMYFQPLCMDGVLVHRIDPRCDDAKILVKLARKVVLDDILEGRSTELSDDVYFYDKSCGKVELLK